MLFPSKERRDRRLVFQVRAVPSSVSLLSFSCEISSFNVVVIAAALAIERRCAARPSRVCRFAARRTFAFPPPCSSGGCRRRPRPRVTAADQEIGKWT